jgi:hypothetical protein
VHESERGLVLLFQESVKNACLSSAHAAEAGSCRTIVGHVTCPASLPSLMSMPRGNYPDTYRGPVINMPRGTLAAHHKQEL